jgi:hypothetical protein
MLNQITNKILTVASSQVGVRESPINSNKGKRVEDYLKAVGLSGGYPWCMAYVVWCVNQLNLKTPLITTLQRGGGHCLTQYNATPKKYLSKIPKEGFIGIMNFGGDKGHTFFVNSVNVNGINTIEGNTNNDGSRNGIGVFYLTRNPKDKNIIGYINLPLWIIDVNNLTETIPEKKNI